MKQYLAGIVLFGFLPLLYAVCYYFGDVWIYLTVDNDDELLEEVQMWQDLPYGLLWFGFIIVALQIHSFSIYFATKLISAWKQKGYKKTE